MIKEEETKKVTIGKWSTEPLVVPLQTWELTKCYDGSILNAIQLNCGNKSISILITDDLYNELRHMMGIMNELNK